MHTNNLIGKRMSIEVCKEAGVVGVRIAGGSDKPFGRGFVRIKQLTAATASSRSGTLKEGDILLQVYIKLMYIILCSTRHFITLKMLGKFSQSSRHDSQAGCSCYIASR